MKTLEQRMRDLAAGMSPLTRNFVPGALIDLLIELCKIADAGQKEREQNK